MNTSITSDPLYKLATNQPIHFDEALMVLAALFVVGFIMKKVFKI